MPRSQQKPASAPVAGRRAAAPVERALPRAPLIPQRRATAAASVEEHMALLNAAKRDAAAGAVVQRGLQSAAKAVGRRQVMDTARRLWVEHEAQLQREERAAEAEVSAALEQAERSLGESANDHATRRARVALRAVREDAAALRKCREDTRGRVAAVARQACTAVHASRRTCRMEDRERCARAVHALRAACDGLARDAAQGEADEASEQATATCREGRDEEAPSDSLIVTAVEAVARTTTTLAWAAESFGPEAAALGNSVVSAATEEALRTAAQADDAHAARTRAAREYTDKLERLAQAAGLSASQVRLLAHIDASGMNRANGEIARALVAPNCAAETAFELARLGSAAAKAEAEIASERTVARTKIDAVAQALRVDLERIARAEATERGRREAMDEEAAARDARHEELALLRERRAATLAERERQQEAAEAAARERAAREEQHRQEHAAEARAAAAEFRAARERREAEEAAARRRVEDELRRERAAEAAAAAPRVEQRRAAFEEARDERAAEAALAAERRRQHEAALERFFASVDERLGVTRDAARAAAPTVASSERHDAVQGDRHVAAAAAGRRPAPGARLHGFTDDALRRDQRSRITNALSTAGLLNTEYGRSVVASLGRVGAALRPSVLNTLATGA